MTSLIAKLRITFMTLNSEDGQDIIEYILLTSLIALAATAGMHALASSINDAFISLADKIGGGLPTA